MACSLLEIPSCRRSVSKGRCTLQAQGHDEGNRVHVEGASGFTSFRSFMKDDAFRSAAGRTDTSQSRKEEMSQTAQANESAQILNEVKPPLLPDRLLLSNVIFMSASFCDTAALQASSTHA